MSEGASAESTPQPKNRGGWILLFGIVEILIGAGTGAMGLLMMVVFLFAERMPGAPLPSQGTKLMAYLALLYGALALFFVAAGAGTLARRRWARIMMLVTSWLWLGLGTLGFSFFIFLLPAIKQGLRSRVPAASSQSGTVILALMVGMLCLIYVLLPASFLFFYTRKSVKAAFERQAASADAAPRHPLPVTILCVLLTLGAAGTLWGLVRGVQVFFGAISTGWVAAALTLSLAAIQAILARGVLRLEAKAWWGAMLFYLVLGLSEWVTFQRISLPDLYDRMGFTFQRQAGAEEFLANIQAYLPIYAVARLLLLLSLLLIARRHFLTKAPAGALPATDPPSPPPIPPSV